jgi:peptidoglycan/xylan/chitin deacetylase (PgdA/CDA1 family)
LGDDFLSFVAVILLIGGGVLFPLKSIKVSVLRNSKRMGLFSMVGHSPWRTRRLLIVGYHGVSQYDEHLWDPALFLTQAALRNHMELLVRNNCSVLSLGEAMTRLARNDLPPRATVITFDDGSYDFLSRALPVIREFGLPVTVYQTSYYSSFNGPVFDVAVSYILWKGAHQKIEGQEFTGVPGLLDLSTKTQRSRVCLQIRQLAHRNRLSTEEKDALLELLAAALKVDLGPMRANRILHLMKPEELSQLVREGIDLQLHTHRHRMPRDRKLFAREIIENRNFLAEVGQPHADHFCYPSGVYEERFLPWLSELGVKSATTCNPGLATSKTRSLLLPRIVVPSALTDIEFEGWLHGFSQVLPRRAGQHDVTPDWDPARELATLAGAPTTPSVL